MNIKKLTVFSLILALSLSFFGGCKNNKQSSTSSEAPPVAEKQLLLFEIDEGLGGYEFVAGCKTTQGDYDYAKMVVMLDNIYSGIKDLMPKYEVAVHIYPEWYYKASGWNSDHSDGLQKWSDDFIYALDYFEERGIGVYLEFFSSTIYVCQNGEEGSLPIVNVNKDIAGAEERNIWGVSCDFQSINALKQHYGDIFKGIRFHELIGTDQLALQGNSHACRIYEEDITAIINYCSQLDIQVLWSDWHWSLTFSNSAYGFWLTRVDNAISVLGDNLVVMLANNSADLVAGVNFTVYDQLAERFSNVNLGYSNQAWFLDSLILGNGKCESQTYIPAEITAGFAQKALTKGAAIVQFEPYFHLFNYTRQSINGGNDYKTGGIAMNYVKPNLEAIQGDSLDYSPRLELLRLVDYLNADTFIFNDLEACYDESQPKINSNNISNPPKMYSQTTFCALSSDEIKYVDSYNNVGDWYEQNENRFTQRVINTEVLDFARISYTVGAFDDVVQVSKVDGKNVGTFYNCIGGYLFTDKTVFADNVDGEFVCFTTANIIQEKSFRGKDADEIIVARKKGDNINLSLYKANGGNDGYTQIVGASASVIEDYFGSQSIPAAKFNSIEGVRNSKAIGKTSNLRNIDGLVVSYVSGNAVTVMGKRYITSTELNQTITVGGNVADIAFGNVDFDLLGEEELAVAVTKNNKTTICFYAFETNKKLVLTDNSVDLGSFTPNRLVCISKSYYLNDSSL